MTGHSGAGKTHAVVGRGRDRSTDTRAEHRGGRYVIDGLDDAVAAGVALIPQGNGLAAMLTAHENVLLPLLARGATAREAPGQAAAALDAVGLGEVHSHLVEELSGGQQQRVAVARALAVRSPVLLADEPTSELDHVNREVVLRLLRDRARPGAAVIMATHDPEAAAAADRVVHLDDGVLTTPARIATHPPSATESGRWEWVGRNQSVSSGDVRQGRGRGVGWPTARPR